jgi:uncharacterized protein (TIGR04222 family)
MWLLFLIPACLLSFLACLRLCRVVAAADRLDPDDALAYQRPHPDQHPDHSGREQAGDRAAADLPTTAYLTGGPERVVDLTLLSMAVRGGLHLAHTGWTTVVHPVGHTPLEQSVIAAIGPGGQCRTAELRQDVIAGQAVRELADRLTLTGLATPPALREDFASAVGAVVRAMLATVLLFAAGLTVDLLGLDNGGGAGSGGAGGDSGGQVATWFVLPLVLTLSTLLMARVDVYPRTRWAAPAGQSVLRAARPDASLSAAVAVGGVRAVRDPLLRAALRG